MPSICGGSSNAGSDWPFARGAIVKAPAQDVQIRHHIVHGTAEHVARGEEGDPGLEQAAPHQAGDVPDMLLELAGRADHVIAP